MKVFKFGGASIKDVERIKNVAEIVKCEPTRPLLLVVSALGKTTNALEKVAAAFFEGRSPDALALFTQIKQQHLNMAKYLLVKESLAFEAAFHEITTEAEWLLHDRPVQGFDYYYDQIVCLGELMSTLLLTHTFRENKMEAGWLDVRDVLKTDDNFRDAGVIWEESKKQTLNQLLPLLQTTGIVVTQGFIGSTDENESTTLGREGSDYTAAIFANMLGATQVTIWKDVEAVLNGDPRLFPETEPIRQLSYHEVVEMAYYGAQVIHPKTMKPLFNAKIPLRVKSFLDPNLPGTLINQQRNANIPPILVKKQAQVLMTFQTKDFSFVGEKPIGDWYLMLEKLHMRPNMIQNGAVELMAVFDDHPEKIGQLAALAEEIFNVFVQTGLHMFTIRHYTEDALQKYTEGMDTLLVQRTRQTMQCVYREG